uniref:Reverse transcriptase domain-containing protein n=1 Tax=Trichogramma kaykai TaxID=54128 RepID=A0ABD2VRG2_9HYME
MRASNRAAFGRKNAIVLSALYHLNNKERSAPLKKASPSLVKALCECALNVLVGNVELSKGHKARLRKHAPVLHKLSQPGIRLTRRKTILLQHGGFLPALLGPLIGTVLASVLTR